MGGSAPDPGKILKSAPSATLTAVKNIAEDSTKVASLGIYNPDNGSLTLDPLKQAQNIGEGITFAGTAKGAYDGVMPKPPKLPAAPDPAAQQARAQAEAKKKVEADLGGASRGYSGTILGGSVSKDTNILRKKRLLGE